MTRLTDAATRFVSAITEGDTALAHGMLAESLSAEFSADDLAAQFAFLAEDMGGVSGVGDAEVMLRDWPGKSPADVAIVYVPLLGDAYSEAITVTLAEKGGALLVSGIAWGRP